MNISLSELIFPKPKNCTAKEGFAIIGEMGQSKCCLLPDKNATELEMESVNLLANKISEKIGIKPEISTSNKINCDDIVIIKISTLKDAENKNLLAAQNSEGYYLKVSEKEIHICGIEDKGIFYAIQTLVQLLQLDRNRLILPLVEIEDWPDMKYRGLFIEDRYGTDIMTLQDWKDAIDYAASLKMNFLGVGVYGCWCIQYDNRISEYWYLPINKYPEIKTPRVIRYYSPSKGGWKTVDFLPEMFEKDFFRELIAYGKKKNVIVRPHFNSLGHNTLIPRMYPETSAKDAEGRPTGYSFCMTNERTYEVLFDIYNEIIDRYLKPIGIDWFHIGLDEVCKMIGIDPEKPFKEFDPWCKCENCSKHSHEELFVEYVIRLAKHLKSKGMKNITMWHDQLMNMNLINKSFVDRLKKEDLYDALIINWWYYSYGIEPVETTKPELNIRRFVTPMTGYFHWVLTDSYLKNIYYMLDMGHREKVEGVEAYCTYDYSYDRNYFCLSEYAWNNTSIGGLDMFRDRYIKKHFSAVYEKAKEALSYYDKFVERPGEKWEIMFSTLTYYCNFAYVRKGKDYPGNFPGEAFLKLYEDIDKYKTIIKEIYEASSAAYTLFYEMSENLWLDRKLLGHYIVESMHYKVLSNEYLTLIELNDKCNDPELLSGSEENLHRVIAYWKDKIIHLGIEREKLMLAVENTKASFLLPSELRNLSIHRQYLIDLELYFEQLLENIKKGVNPVLPLIDLKDTRNIEDKLLKLLR